MLNYIHLTEHQPNYPKPNPSPFPNLVFPNHVAKFIISYDELRVFNLVRYINALLNVHFYHEAAMLAWSWGS